MPKEFIQIYENNCFNPKFNFWKKSFFEKKISLIYSLDRYSSVSTTPAYSSANRNRFFSVAIAEIFQNFFCWLPNLRVVLIWAGQKNLHAKKVVSKGQNEVASVFSAFSRPKSLFCKRKYPLFANAFRTYYYVYQINFKKLQKIWNVFFEKGRNWTTFLQERFSWHSCFFFKTWFKKHKRIFDFLSFTFKKICRKKHVLHF